MKRADPFGRGPAERLLRQVVDGGIACGAKAFAPAPLGGEAKDLRPSAPILSGFVVKMTAPAPGHAPAYFLPLTGAGFPSVIR